MMAKKQWLSKKVDTAKREGRDVCQPCSGVISWGYKGIHGERVLSLISSYSRENAYFYIDNRNIRGFCLYKDDLHLLESGKKILANIFIVNLNNFFSRYKHTPSTNIFMNDSDLSETSSLATDLQVLHHERLQHKKTLW